MSSADVQVTIEEAGGDVERWIMRDKPPVRVDSAPRLSWDLEALISLFEGDVPTR
jgi:hypothetical protein